MSKAQFYLASQGQCWDQVAKDIWGREDLMYHLLAANPQHRHLLVLPADLLLVIPEVEVPPIEEVPPWQQR